MKKSIIIQTQALVSLKHPERGVTAGGTQRYAMQLAKLFKSMDYDVYFIARAFSPYEFDLDAGHVIVVEAKSGLLGDVKYSKAVYDFAASKDASYVFYLDMRTAKYYVYPKSIAFQHGINWDGPVKIHQRIKRFFTSREYIRLSAKFKKVICVDTNYINWVREHDHRFFKTLGKYVYLPNFADEEQFIYNYSEWTSDREFVLLYPRRFVEYRGYSIFIEMCERLKEKGYNIHPVIAFEKNASDDYSSVFKDKKCQYEIIHPKLNEIFKEYQRAFLTFVPTIWSEGTSLSAIESICSGCPVIVSDVGGLGNVIIPGFNGDIVAPTVSNFVEATERVLNDVSVRNKWAANCESCTAAFGVKRWNEKIIKLIEEI